ncbi:MAG TPA: hypothetical protein ENF70_05400 [Deltaproteobacteria bacterium]|nr:hypothetical protein [Deltaproteobacteria bacterium]
MSEVVTYTTTVILGVAARSALLAAAGTISAISRGAGSLRKLEASEAWQTMDEREIVLKNAFASRFAELEQENGSPGKCLGDAQSRLLKVKAMYDALSHVPAMSAMANAENESELAQISCDTTNWLNQLKDGNVGSDLLGKIDGMESTLRHIATSAHKKLIGAETQVLRQNLKDSVEASGYQLSEREGNIRATKGTTCIWMEFTDRGEMSLDASGFSGLSCQKEISALETQLSQRGIVLQRKSSHFHGRPEGGDVAQRLAKIFSTVKPEPVATVTKGKTKARSKRKKQTRQTVRS